MLKEQLRILEGIDGWMEFVTQNSEKRWLLEYQNYKNFKERFNRWPSGAKSKPNLERKLAQWSVRQVQARFNPCQNSCQMTDKRFQLLEAIGFTWGRRGRDEINLSGCLAFKEQHDRWPSEYSENQEEKCLGKWLALKKNAKNGTGGWKISENEIKALDKAGFQWRRPKKAKEDEFVKIVAKNRIKTLIAYRKWWSNQERAIQSFLPAQPTTYYGRSTVQLFGFEHGKPIQKSFEEALRIVRFQNFLSKEALDKWDRPDGIPKSLHAGYSGDKRWINEAFFCTGEKSWPPKRHGNAGLSEQKVREIRLLRAKGNTGMVISKKLKLPHELIYRIINGKSYIGIGV